MIILRKQSMVEARRNCMSDIKKKVLTKYKCPE